MAVKNHMSPMPVWNPPGVPLDDKFQRFPTEEQALKLLGSETGKTAHGLFYAGLLGLGKKNADQNRFFAVDMIEELAPKGVHEGMLVTQIIASHCACMCAMGKMSDAKDLQAREAYSRVAQKTSSRMTVLTDKLRDAQSCRQASMSVSQVTIQDGGDAIVCSLREQLYQNE